MPALTGKALKHCCVLCIRNWASRWRHESQENNGFMVAELNALRDQIDEVDKALLDLLSRRLHLVAEVGEVKSRYGLPIYVPEREAAMLASRRQEAQQMGVPPDLIEDVLRRVMRESYSSENDKGFKTLRPELRPIVIVGGGGQMGRLDRKSTRLNSS